MKDILYGISDNSDFAILEMEVDKTHVHILVKSESKISVLQIVRRLKLISIVKIWKEAPKYLINLQNPKNSYPRSKMTGYYGNFPLRVGFYLSVEPSSLLLGILLCQ